MYTVKINTIWTRLEMLFIIKETLNTIWNSVNSRCRGAPISLAAIESDLHFAVVVSINYNFETWEHYIH